MTFVAALGLEHASSATRHHLGGGAATAAMIPDAFTRVWQAVSTGTRVEPCSPSSLAVAVVSGTSR
jgi:hypothetical protein